MNEKSVESKRGPKVRRTQSEREKLLAAYRGSGLSRPEFCRREGVHYTTLCGWLAGEKRLGNMGGKRRRWVKAAVSPLSWLGGTEAVAEVELVGGVRVRLMRGCDAGMVGMVLEAASRCGR